MSAHVYLVGAGPGDPGLVTLRARDLIARCDVLVYDRLVNPELRAWVKSGCELIYVGKDPHLHAIPQEQIEDLIVARAKAGKTVVRLKGGDPFIFGRGGEEARRLARDGVSFEIVPGVTAALAAAAYAGIPLTHRDYASSLCFLTGHEDQEKHALRVKLKKFASIGGTLCLYMAMGQLERITGELLSGGLAADTPVAVVQWATTPQQKTLFSTLGKIVQDTTQAGLGAPAVVIIGAAVKAADSTGWFQSRPLFGRRIVVPRAKEQAGELRRKLEELGAEVLELPLIEIHPDIQPERAEEIFSELATYEWGVFTSPNGARLFLEEVMRRCHDVRALGPMKFACLGPATAREVEKYHLEVALLPAAATADALADALIAGESLDNLRVLVVTGNRNREDLPRRLENEARAIVDTFPVYRTELTDLGQNPAADTFRTRGADAIAFTSASTVESFVQQAKHLVLAPGARRPLACAIGPLTAKELKQHKIPVDIEAPEHTLDGLAESIHEKLAARG
ncbi:MAG TPA: uroporphyrinogen-III C-methyltransferase [Opitutales bacterium]|jgi:uroporphyrinogen III methyltransferase/synthase|nr:uroporphyrinogen-III C-methyltransferase [Opitutales bacterium]